MIPDPSAVEPVRGRSDDDILTLIREVAEVEGEPLSRHAFETVAGFSGAAVVRRFGTWTAACAKAGVETAPATRRYAREWSDKVLVERVRAFLGATADPTWAAFRKWCREHPGASAETVRLRFGTWREAQRRAMD